jgi:hypothetical protein
LGCILHPGHDDQEAAPDHPDLAGVERFAIDAGLRAAES